MMNQIAQSPSHETERGTAGKAVHACAAGAGKELPPIKARGASAAGGVPDRLRRLKSNELVSLGDFIVDEHRGLEPWEGPGGFRADAFVKPIYRRDTSRPAAARKLR